MVQALLSGRKSQTRRLLNPQPDAWAEAVEIAPYASEGGTYGRQGSLIQRTLDDRRQHGCGRVRYAPGDRLYVREAHALVGNVDPPWVIYRASGYDEECVRLGFARPVPPEYSIRWRPSIHMPRWASRITLTVTEVRVQRLQDISEADALAEGCLPARWDFQTPADHYRDLWNSLHGPDAWARNDWVRVLTFTTEQRNIDQATP
jgi:hypothetical protein